MCKTALAFTIQQPETACHLLTTRGPSCTMDCGSSKIEEGLQVIVKTSPRFTVNWPALASSILEDSGPVLQIGGAERSRQCGACRIRRQALLLAREGIKTLAK